MSRIILLTAVGIFITSSGCSRLICSSNSLATTSPLPQVKSSSSIRLGSMILEAIKYKNYALLEDVVFSTSIARELTDEKFISSCDLLEQKLGQIKSFTYITQLTTPEVENHIWQVSFVQKKSNGTIIQRDLLFRLITGRINNVNTVLSYGFL